MKKFNINHNILIQITELGWEHLKNTVGVEYISTVIDSRKVIINNENWYDMQAHQVFELLPISFVGPLLLNTNILIKDNDLTDL